jgi:hypothetical protein
MALHLFPTDLTRSKYQGVCSHGVTPLGMDTEVRGKLEPLRGKLSKLADRGWPRKLSDGCFTALL